MVFCLSHLYNRHTMIHSKKHAWCTIEDGLNIDYEAACDTHLLFMGNNMFGELLPKSVTWLGSIPNLLLSTPPLQKSTTSTSTKHDTDGIEGTDPAEFPKSVPDQASLDATTSHEGTDNPDYDGTLDTVLLVSSKNTQSKGTCPVHPHCNTNRNDSMLTPPIEKTASSIMLAVLKHQCNVSLQQLTTEQLQHWLPPQTNLTSSSSDIISTDSEDNVPLSELAKLVNWKENTSTSSTDGFSTEDNIPLCDFNKPCTRSCTRKKPTAELEDRFPRKSKNGISYVESELSKTNSENSPIRKKCKINPLLLPGPSNSRLKSQRYITRSKTDQHSDKNRAIPSIPPNPLPSEDATVEDDTIKPKSPKGSLQVQTHGLMKPRKVRNFKCKLCDVVTTSRKDLNTHHKTTHDKVSCPNCNREFNIPSSLDRHIYSHQADLKHKCEHCGKLFAFLSQLHSHKVIYKKLATLKCNKSIAKGKVSGKWFKWAGELKKHLLTHDKITWRCKDCEYSTYDERNLKQHLHKHTGKRPFKCADCEQCFTYWTQRACHKCTKAWKL